MERDARQGSEERIDPTLQFSVLCDGIIKDPTTTKLAFVGVFEAILEPATVPQFFIVNKWIHGKGRFSQVIEILSPDLQPILTSTPQEVVLPERNLGAIVATGFINTTFSQSGVYWVQVKIDGELALAYPVTVQESGSSSQISTS